MYSIKSQFHENSCKTQKIPTFIISTPISSSETLSVFMCYSGVCILLVFICYLYIPSSKIYILYIIGVYFGISIILILISNYLVKFIILHLHQKIIQKKISHKIWSFKFLSHSTLPLKAQQVKNLPVAQK